MFALCCFAAVLLLFLFDLFLFRALNLLVTRWTEHEILIQTVTNNYQLTSFRRRVILDASEVWTGPWTLNQKNFKK